MCNTLKQFFCQISSWYFTINQNITHKMAVQTYGYKSIIGLSNFNVKYQGRD